MRQLKDYTGSVYGGLGQLLYAYYQAQGLAIPEKLQRIQHLERFDYSLWRELLLELDAQLRRPALGLEIAELVQPKHLGIIAYIAMSCENLGEALQRYHDFHRLIYDGSPLQVTAQGGLLSIRWSELPQNMTAQITDETAIALMVGFLKHFMDFKNIRLHAVHFQSAAPRHAALYAQYFGCKVRFSQPCSEVLLPVQELSAPFLQGDQTLQQLLTQQAQSLLQKLPHSTQTDQRLQQAILTGLQKNQFQIEHIAGQLNIPVRQLQRHLQQQGASYQQRMQEVRCMLAEQYLRDPHLSLQEIALLLGYSEQSAFQRAFKRWLQLTPQQWRRQNLPAR
ncbi:AraC family transcriptional regulator [Acinetobacter sp.]|uniref:AraC family transcriptional regulator n=1 Tax=Acinetobacter sp. TaxID=472 RepID=UPI002FCACF06